MKDGRSITELAAEIERQSSAKRDFLAPSQRMAMELLPSFTKKPDGTDELHQTPRLSIPVNGNGEAFGFTDLAHEQLSARLGIPRKYYDLMHHEAPELLQNNVNHWLWKAEPTQRRLVRTLDGRVRAFLSDSYRPLDNIGVAEAVLPVLGSMPGLKIVSCEVTERRLYIKAINERVQGEVRKGDVVQAGVYISNSEVGCGALWVTPLIFRLVCLNGMIREDAQMRKYHAGKNLSAQFGEGAIDWNRITDETKAATDRAFWLTVRDMTKMALEDTRFAQHLDVLRAAAGQKIDREPEEVVEVVGRKLGYTETEGKGVLKHLLMGGDLTRWGMANAVTRFSQDVSSYDRATELERIGGQVVELPQTEWRKLASVN